MSDVKQESLANAKVRMARNSSACMKAPSKEIYGRLNQRKEHNVDLKSTFSG